MDFVRVSTLKSAQSSTSIRTLTDCTLQDENCKATCTKMCEEILPLLMDDRFQSKYWTTPIGIPDCYVFSHWSSRCLILEVVTRYPDAQVENLHTYKFCAHSLFEEKLRTYTRFKGSENPNPSLVRSRPWDVALNVVMKIEALPMPYNTFRYLLKHEYQVLKHVWGKYTEKTMDIDEMTGIPMIFEYVEIPNNVYFIKSDGNIMNEIDIHGKMKRIAFEPGTSMRSALSYMTMEKLGPNVDYLQQLMRATQAPPLTFDLWTALKIFDQLLCRIMQVHRFGVVHNDICLENIYMGNGVAFDVVYLNNYKRAYVIVQGDRNGPGGLASSCVGCNIRFASVGQLSGVPSLMRPIDDVESAFYVLLAMLNADALPWDGLLKISRSSENPQQGSSSNSYYNSDAWQSNAYDDRTMQVGSSTISTETVRKLHEFKQRFWQSNKILNMVLANAAGVFSSDKYQADTVTALILEIYFRLRDWRQTFKGGESCFDYCIGLNRTTSEEFRQFTDLRKCALMHFKFSETFDIINDIRFRERVAQQLSTQELKQQPWNSIVWCFNNVEIRTESKSQTPQTSLHVPLSRFSWASIEANSC